MDYKNFKNGGEKRQAPWLYIMKNTRGGGRIGCWGKNEKLRCRDKRRKLHKKRGKMS